MQSVPAREGDRPTTPRPLRRLDGATLPPGARGARAYAKINLHLEVVRRREDGYHQVESVLQSIDLFDTLHFVPCPSGVTLFSNVSTLPTDESNLCLRAARSLLAHVGREDPPRGVRIDLYKSIPVSAGLGGGSADAAATLVGLNEFWDLRLDEKTLSALGGGLGSDIPFCLRGGTALAHGRGDQLETLPAVRPTEFLLVFPALPVSTAWAYENLRMGLTRRSYALSMSELKSILARYPDTAQGFYNRLEDAVCPAHSVVAEIINRLLELGAIVASMSGSGSGVFGAFRTRAEALEARSSFGQTQWKTAVVGSVRKGVELFA